MASFSSRKTMTADEVRKRLDRATNTIDLGSGSLLGPASSKFTADETERSLNRLLKIERAVRRPNQ